MPENAEINKMKLQRMNFFTDAVVAIILTLLVLELHLPKLADANSPEEMMHAFTHILPHILGFLLCFCAVATGWVVFNAFFSLVAKYDETLGILNLLMLLPFCLLPFASAIIGEYPDNPLSFVFFGLLYLLGSTLLTIMTAYMRKKGMYTDVLNKEKFEGKTLKMWWVSPLIILLIIGSAFINTMLSFILFFVMLITWMYMMKFLRITKIEKKN